MGRNASSAFMVARIVKQGGISILNFCMCNASSALVSYLVAGCEIKVKYRLKVFFLNMSLP
ncbi:hypothetical protein Bca101_009747 [Brassica carinata]